MSWRTRKNGRLSAIQNCTECGIRLEPIFKCDRDPEYWHWTECEICSEPYCEDCSDYEDDKDRRICIDCLQDEHHRNKRQEEKLVTAITQSFWNR